ncbi:hypothetical protein CEF21_04940 [Bacillus sp. FJAT-42376]|uniref:hypothetical protein n=1 Tax=Bacillus sp. FJAT-42376 TaxID=2014076 RepID=UPI000F51081A|nr:hypothetical protein [Bacillus sp. FJAT-42376]AZB41697.1 hypothetical protein CEF21_04940 [Bacillus sp. FJAT-42376]
MTKTRRIIYWMWMFASMFLSLAVCKLAIPVRSDYFPDAVDYLFSFIFLIGAAVCWSTIVYGAGNYVKSRNQQGLLGLLLFVLLVTIYAYFFRGMYSRLTYFLLPFTGTLVIGFLHYGLTYLLHRKRTKGKPEWTF